MFDSFGFFKYEFSHFMSTMTSTTAAKNILLFNLRIPLVFLVLNPLYPFADSISALDALLLITVDAEHPAKVCG